MVEFSILTIAESCKAPLTQCIEVLEARRPPVNEGLYEDARPVDACDLDINTLRVARAGLPGAPLHAR